MGSNLWEISRVTKRRSQLSSDVPQLCKVRGSYLVSKFRAARLVPRISPWELFLVVTCNLCYLQGNVLQYYGCIVSVMQAKANYVSGEFSLFLFSSDRTLAEKTLADTNLVSYT